MTSKSETCCRCVLCNGLNATPVKFCLHFLSVSPDRKKGISFSKERKGEIKQVDFHGCRIHKPFYFGQNCDSLN